MTNLVYVTLCFNCGSAFRYADEYKGFEVACASCASDQVEEFDDFDQAQAAWDEHLKAGAES